MFSFPLIFDTCQNLTIRVSHNLFLSRICLGLELFFSSLLFPSHFFSSLLQASLSDACHQLGGRLAEAVDSGRNGGIDAFFNFFFHSCLVDGS